MGIRGRTFGGVGFAVIAAVAALVGASPAVAFAPLPPGGQVNDDLAAGINPGLSVAGEDPTNADVVGGALTAGKVAVPWAIFRQTEAAGNKDQVFSRSFAQGVWTTRGSGTVGGSSSAAPIFAGSLNFDQAQDGEAPAIDFAGAGRTVPWATWYENTVGAGFGANNVFASRFDNTGDANQGKWIFAGQNRGTGGANSVPVPSLNIHTNQSAENPSVAGGSAVDPTTPGPWVTWQETGANAPGATKNQIFVEKSVGPGQTDCSGITPTGSGVIGGFCWQQVGVERLGADPSLNVDRTRDGVEPDIAFTGANDAVPWVVWYEQNNSADGLRNNEMVFAAKGVAPSVSTPPTGPVDGGFNWISVGTGVGSVDGTSQGVLDNSAHGGFCGQSLGNEAACSLNNNPDANAEDPRVAAGTMNSANPTVPWVAWDEAFGGHQQVFVSRLVGAGAAAHFQLANGGAPISTGTGDSTRPDITFSGNTPYVTWREDGGGGVERAFVGHFVNAANPMFVLDESDVPLTPTAQADVREPISSSCTANPFNVDGAACQGGAIGTPFFLVTNGAAPSPLGLFADAYQPSTPVTGAAAAVSTSAASVSGSVNPEGGPVSAFFQFGTTTAYTSATAAQRLGPDNTDDTFTAALSALPAGIPIHYRAVAMTDFGVFVGADRTVTIAAPPKPTPKPGIASVGHIKVKGRTATVAVTCRGATNCRVSLTLTVHETLRGRRIVAVSAAKTKKPKLKHRLVVVGSASATVRAGKTAKLKVSLNRTGRGLLAARHRLTTTLTVRQRGTGKKTKVVARRKVTFASPVKRKRHH
jgi:hypothetical protein